MLSTAQLSPEYCPSLGSEQSSVGVSDHHVTTIPQRKHHSEGNHAHHRVGARVRAPSLVQGLLPVAASGVGSEALLERRAK